MFTIVLTMVDVGEEAGMIRNYLLQIITMITRLLDVEDLENDCLDCLEFKLD